MRKNKYNAEMKCVGGRKFHSKTEANRYVALKNLEKAREIEDLKCQVRFPFEHNGVHFSTYIADFTYYDKCKKFVVEDVKSEYTAKLSEFKWKAKAMKAFYGIEVQVYMKK